MIAPNHNGRLQFTIADHFIKGEAQLVSLSETDPADTRRQTLEVNALTGRIQPLVEMWVIRNQLLHLGVSLVDILRVTRERCPTERPDTATEQWAHVSGNETREIERVLDTLIQSYLAYVVAVVKRRDALLLELQHCLYVYRHRLH